MGEAQQEGEEVLQDGADKQILENKVQANT